jgi:hypothetical protein
LACGVAAFLMLTVVGIVIAQAERLVPAGWQEILDRFPPADARSLHPAWTAAIVFVVVLVGIVKNGSPPEFVYKGF